MARENSGSLRKNDKREKDSHPHYRGSANVNGVDFWLSAWVKESDDGKWLSLSFQPKDEKPAAKPTPKAKQVELDDDSTLPF